MRTKTILKYMVAIAGTLSLLTGCNGGEQSQGQQNQQSLPFPVVKIQNKEVTGYQVFPASIEGIVNSSVRAKVSGYIKEVLVDEGQKVRKGQSLFKLETESLSQDAEAAKASINVAEVEVNKLKPLVEKGIVSEVQLETAKANLAQAKSSYNSVTANIGYATVKSPVDGYVGAIPFRLGSLVSPADQMAMTTVSDISKVYAYFSFNEKDYLNFLENTEGKSLQEKIKNFPEVILQLANGTLYKHKGKIQTITGQINQATGTVSVRAVFDNPDQLLTNGNSGKIMIPSTYKDNPVIPQAATFERQGQILAFKVDDQGKISTVVLQIKDNIDNLYVVESGLKAGDRIVSSGVGKLKEDMEITPQEVSYDSVTKPIKVSFRN
ncbi:membrane fusion protein, multidrug efflux system [Sinomicrobium oceani]|uniref:Membrane fusion protein, multidrug efflux system n=1 Tax=Sinomicrobium oceani TaxID=1150368 RepID=A0A1K1P0K4_9FLAO|nr:efflux RND transporter periplasmic adaptor subunit [Sinomicrobium oceani]SFW41111.1 membrane fusion protein, multidrug efflux system [Sinomicrobium oceani]